MTHLEFRAALDALGLYQAEAARLIGVDEGTVRRWMGVQMPNAAATSQSRSRASFAF